MEQTECPKTPAYKILMPGNYKTPAYKILTPGNYKTLAYKILMLGNYKTLAYKILMLRNYKMLAYKILMLENYPEESIQQRNTLFFKNPCSGSYRKKGGNEETLPIRNKSHLCGRVLIII